MQQPKGPNVVLFGVITTITIFVWIAFEVYKILTPTNLETIPDAVLLPLDPTLDFETLKKLETRRNFSDSEIGVQTRVVATSGPILVEETQTETEEPGTETENESTSSAQP